MLSFRAGESSRSSDPAGSSPGLRQLSADHLRESWASMQALAASRLETKPHHLQAVRESQGNRPKFNCTATTLHLSEQDGARLHELAQTSSIFAHLPEQ